MDEQIAIRKMELLKKSGRALGLAAGLGLAGLVLVDCNTNNSSLNYNRDVKASAKIDDIKVDPAHNIASLIKGAINETKVGRGPKGYKDAYDLCDKAIIKARESYQRIELNDKEKISYKGLEIIALMRQSYILLDQAVRNIIDNGEQIKLKGMEVITSDANVGNKTRKYNLLKALENYEMVREILEESRKQGKRFPNEVGLGLGGHGQIATPALVYQRVLETVNALKKIAPDLYQQHSTLLDSRASKLISSKTQ